MFPLLLLTINLVRMHVILPYILKNSNVRVSTNQRRGLILISYVLLPCADFERFFVLEYVLFKNVFAASNIMYVFRLQRHFVIWPNDS